MKNNAWDLSAFRPETRRKHLTFYERYYFRARLKSFVMLTLLGIYLSFHGYATAHLSLTALIAIVVLASKQTRVYLHKVAAKSYRRAVHTR
jgi:hypothetical protein